MAFATLPPWQLEDLHKIQRGMLRELAETMEALDSRLARDLKRAIIRLDRLGWRQDRVRMVIGAVVAAHWDRVDHAALETIKSAERHAETYMRRLAHFAVTTRTLEPIMPSKVAFWTAPGRGRPTAQAVVAYTRGKPPGAVAALLSTDLHRIAANEAAEVSNRVLTAIREAQSIEYASRDLVTQWPRGISPISRGRGPIGYQVQWPAKIKEIQSHINNLGKVTGDTLKADLSGLRGYLTRLKPGGRMRLGYAELVHDLAKGKAAEASLDKWAHQKQRYLAERILETEQQRAFRLAQIEMGAGIPGLIGYRWHMNRSKHARYLRSKPGRISPARAGRMMGGLGPGAKGRRLAGKHCICEAMDGTIISLEDFKGHWSAGGHPHCACFFEEVFDTTAMLKAAETSEEKQWLDAMGF